MKKLLHIALKNQNEPNCCMTQSFRNAGYEVEEIDWQSFFRQKDKHVVFHDAKEVLNEHIIMRAELSRPDIIFMQIQSGGVINKETASVLKNIGFTINWTGDVRANIEWYEDLAPLVDVTLFTNETDVEKMRSKGHKADYLQVGFDQEIFKPSNIEQEVRPIVFLGNNYGSNINFPLSEERREMVHQMRYYFARRFMVYGHGWDYLIKDDKNTHLSSIHGGTPDEEIRHLKPSEENICYANCKIAINQNHFDYKKFSSDRLLRIMASGAFCLTKYYVGIEDEYENKKHLVWWKDIDELLLLCNYYLDPANEAERIEIAKQGCAHVHEKCTWDYRFKNELPLIINKYEAQR